MLLEAGWGRKKEGGFIVLLGGTVDSWPLSVHTRLCLDNERQRERERKRQKRNKGGEKERERERLIVPVSAQGLNKD